jgi:hypothetical protein
MANTPATETGFQCRTAGHHRLLRRPYCFGDGRREDDSNSFMWDAVSIWRALRSSSSRCSPRGSFLARSLRRSPSAANLSAKLEVCLMLCLGMALPPQRWYRVLTVSNSPFRRSRRAALCASANTVAKGWEPRRHSAACALRQDDRVGEPLIPHHRTPKENPAGTAERGSCRVNEITSDEMSRDQD